ncbi:hypothetical protein AMAG_07448 [Allomyces macrogynus ATCC 38327]|uniref:Serine aminopeptidase S33 domain-containing protein n=1 Tax=Allomyces macrogynus (strain ATCC 38327) TaxID=578462 RepID=A0A0L0SIB0_ALLM3|nr:hypothetical protein AMAG_07448 [Allomyces macrogynus ATCC 38327]|eukprot:KNE62207.1 hypothetical protein AMAG_07448 [Allomyces macrogynus ATCC 38327]
MPGPISDELREELLNPTVGEWITLRDGHVVYGRTWTVPEGTELIATLTWVHGLGEHINRYDHAFTKIAQAGIQVHAWDQRGFGRTALRNNSVGQIKSWSQVLDDVADALHRSAVPWKPKYLGGHSFGALVVLDFYRQRGIHYHLAGVIATGPPIEGFPDVHAPPFALTALRIAAALFPTRTAPSKVDASALCHDEAIVKDYMTDPLVSNELSYRFTNGMIRAMVRLSQPHTLRHLHSYIPLLLMHGGDDRITYVGGTRHFYERATKLIDCTLKVYDGCLHELHNEPAVRDEVVQEWIDFMRSRVRGPVRQRPESPAPVLEVVPTPAG